jgi:tRNA(adenine34) deaminase
MKEWIDMTEDERFMRQAITQAKKALKNGDVPIGCVIVREGKVIARGYNRRNMDRQSLAHAELMAIKKASKIVGDWRLEDCKMYVTLEPCQMCAGAIVQARMPEVIMGCMNPKAGCAGSVINLLDMEGFNHRVKIKKGILQEECSTMLTDFFKKMREKGKEKA